MAEHIRTIRRTVALDKDKCLGCTSCLKRCPTEAIRIRGGRAHVIDERCIDCGECIRVCPHHAKIALTDPFEIIDRYKHKIALPAPALFGQFRQAQTVDQVLEGLQTVGFDAVYAVAHGADIVSRAVREKLDSGDFTRPMISSACPAILRLIQVRFPELLDNVADIDTPMETAAIMSKRWYSDLYGVDPSDIGCFFITPCAAKVTAIRHPVGIVRSNVDGAISMPEIFSRLSASMPKTASGDANGINSGTAFGFNWGRAGGELNALNLTNGLAVDGIDNVIEILELIENNKLSGIDFFEGLACTGGCVGGPLTIENGFIARERLKKLIAALPVRTLDQAISDEELHSCIADITFSQPLQPLHVMKLDDDISVALKKMERMETLTQGFPGLDCGSCGSPTCRAHAEDIVRGYAHEMECLHKLRERLRVMAQQMVEISQTDRMVHTEE